MSKLLSCLKLSSSVSVSTKQLAFDDPSWTLGVDGGEGSGEVFLSHKAKGLGLAESLARLWLDSERRKGAPLAGLTWSNLMMPITALTFWTSLDLAFYSLLK